MTTALRCPLRWPRRSLAAPLRRRAGRRKTIRIIVPYTPGGARTSWPARSSEKLAAALRQTVIVENKGGRQRQHRHRGVAKSPARRLHAPDGRRRRAGDQPSVYAKLPFDSDKDLRGVSMLAVLAAPARRASVGAGEQPEGVRRAVAEASRSSASQSPRSAARRTWPADRCQAGDRHAHGRTSRTRAARRRSATPSPARPRC